MRRLLLTLTTILAMTAAANATASFGCSPGLRATEKNGIELEMVTSRDGKYVDSLRAELVFDGEKIEFTKADLKSFHWGKNVAIVIAKQSPRGLLEVRAYAKALDEDNIEFEGNIVARRGQVTRNTGIKCSGG